VQQKKYSTYFVIYTNSEMKKCNKMQSWKVQRAYGIKDSNFYLKSFLEVTLSQMHFYNHGIPPWHKTARVIPSGCAGQDTAITW